MRPSQQSPTQKQTPWCMDHRFGGGSISRWPSPSRDEPHISRFDWVPTARPVYKMTYIPIVFPRVCADTVMDLERSYHAQCAASRSGHAHLSALAVTRALKRAVTRAPMWPGEAASSVGSRTRPNTFLWPGMIEKGSGWVARPTQHPYSAHHVMLPSANMRQRRDMHKHAAAS